MAIMGPSGCGKTTLLNLLARRNPTSSAKVAGKTLVGGSEIDTASFQHISSYVEQEDTLIGSLTVEETLKFSAELSLAGYVAVSNYYQATTTYTTPHRSTSKAERMNRVQLLLRSFGIQDQAKTLIGTPIRKGISGGQKRRLSVASQLITSPKILFMDEPTSGLDSTASHEVISYLKKLARRNNVGLVFDDVQRYLLMVHV